jgi:rRNA maturation protein Nop10
MSYVTCPQCRASFHAGALYVQQESCPRCGTPFVVARRSFRDQLASSVLRRRRPAEALDWEAITSSQYALRQHVSRSGHDAEVGGEPPSRRAA